jgi:hypothetical protein
LAPLPSFSQHGGLHPPCGAARHAGKGGKWSQIYEI